jgi:hypothetical protein
MLKALPVGKPAGEDMVVVAYQFLRSLSDRLEPPSHITVTITNSEMPCASSLSLLSQHIARPEFTLCEALHGLINFKASIAPAYELICLLFGSTCVARARVEG